jgi:hypothetical protein
VARYLDLVHSSALRLVGGDAHLVSSSGPPQSHPKAC